MVYHTIKMYQPYKNILNYLSIYSNYQEIWFTVEQNVLTLKYIKLCFYL